jgi:MinD-like ATPase involved in chromosome partitioning or flagellar assembly
MNGERFVVVGLAPPRARWFAQVAHWATAGTLPLEFVKCLSGEELRARLASGRPFSALLVDAAVAALDRDLVDVTQRTGCAVVVVESGRGGRDRSELGADADLPADFDPRQLIDTLSSHGRVVGAGNSIGPLAGDELPESAGAGAPVAAVCGPGGAGSSTVAMALAQGLAMATGTRRRVVLADLCLHAELGMLHDARDVVPGLQELVEAHRAGRPAQAEVRGMAFGITERGYDLVLGLRRARAWAGLRPRALAAALDGLTRSYDAVVFDADADVEGEAEGGSVDVEERNLMARSALALADVVFVVGLPGVKGVHSLVRVIADLVAFGVPGDRIVAVVNRAPRGARPRADLGAAITSLISPAHVGVAVPVFLPERHVDEALRDGVRLPAALCDPVTGAFSAVLDRHPARAPACAGPVPVVPGSLGHWPDQSAASA